MRRDLAARDTNIVRLDLHKRRVMHRMRAFVKNGAFVVSLKSESKWRRPVFSDEKITLTTRRENSTLSLGAYDT